ncbi:putative acyl esterase [Streptomyces pseudovenezuelae]|uniref:Acyl esterase n=1 Tax=Streptomyces pseudovenezuelae TaxID=67350 RepID=A0ABT6M1N9_9ACTN|nr:putative acyl esterase [Streptomyces pseudovenezuelae]
MGRGAGAGCGRLPDVAPDGSATQVTYGVLNLTRRDSADEPPWNRASANGPRCT